MGFLKRRETKNDVQRGSMVEAISFLKRKEKKSEKAVKPGSVVEAIVQKESDKVKYGIVFHRSKRYFPTTIESITPKGIFDSKGLQPGMYLLEVNGEEYTWKSPHEAAIALKNAPVGSDVSIKAILPKTIRVKRDSEATSWGFAIKNSTSREGIYVENVIPGGLAARAGLEHGMLLLNINGGETFPNDLKEAASALRSQGNNLELTVVQLEIAVDIDQDPERTAGSDTAGIELPEGREEIETLFNIDDGIAGIELQQGREKIDTLLMIDEDGRDDIDGSNPPNQETIATNSQTGNQKKSNNFSLLGDSQNSTEIIDLDDIVCAETKSEAPREESTKNQSSNKESRKVPAKNEKKKNSSKWFAKEEECFDLDDQFPERYTESNNSLFQNVLQASKTPSVMSHVMQLRKLRQPITTLPIITNSEGSMANDKNTGTDDMQNVLPEKKKTIQWLSNGGSSNGRESQKLTLGESVDAIGTPAFLFGVKNEVSSASARRYDPRERKPRFFRLPAKSKQSEKTEDHKMVEETKESDRLYDMLYSFPDLVCTTLCAVQQDTTTTEAPQNDVTSVTSATSRRTIMPLRFRRKRTKAETVLRNEEALEL